ncbi:pentapeptide repeat-containing protein [Chitinophaga horti]|uniref:Pentapeptide repeat-containing protein n=1 Tax=Chitinophaga horti TaxID=2920382 RepID=A0ABY6IXM3_9BACT|nr:pentapeptide repeat-containing protein [Chitinophaga horti]UYQ92136.1 pentapeptide repeat-containing protein [Chitinophaga horti]
MSIHDEAYEKLKQGPIEFHKWLSDHSHDSISFNNRDLTNRMFSLTMVGGLGRPDLRNIDFGGANLQGANFRYTDIRGCNFEGANLMNVRFTKAYAEKCNFRSANLRNASFHRALVDEANFTNADLEGADFTIKGCVGADMSGAKIKGMEFQTTFEGNPWDELPENFLFAKNLELVHPNGQESIREYITSSFFDVYRDNKEKLTWSEFDSHVKNMISQITHMFTDGRPSETIVSLVQHINTELLMHLKKHPHDIHHLHWRGFEELVAELLASFGWSVELTSATKDNGYDIFGIYKDDSGIRHSWIIECKKYNPDRKVGIEVVRSLYGVKTDLRVGNALLATTSSFTEGVDNFKASRYDLDTKNLNGIIEWVNSYKRRDSGLYINDNRIDFKHTPLPRP